MKIISLIRRTGIEHEAVLLNEYAQFDTMIRELRKKYIPSAFSDLINQEISEINAFEGSYAALGKELRKRRSRILLILARELKLVTRNYYRNVWFVLGMVAFGIPLGIVIGGSLDNMGLLAIGIPVGMIIGLIVGADMDKSAYEEGRQLDLLIQS